MKNARTWAAALAGLLALAFAGASLPAASAAPADPAAVPKAAQSNGSEGGLFIYSSSGVLIADVAYEFARSEAMYGSGGSDNVMTPIAGTAAATAASTETYTFIASPATVRAGGIHAWEAWAPNGLAEGGAVAPQLTPSAQVNANGAGLAGVFADIGGTYYLGVAFTKNDGVTVDSAVYRTMHILPGNRYTLDPIEFETQVATDGGAGDATAQPLESVAPMNATLEGEQFELVMPPTATLELGTVQRGEASASPATLSGLSIIDTRGSQLGWSLSITATDFVSGTNTISAAWLGYEPVLAGVPQDGVTLGSPKPAGSTAFGALAVGAPGFATTAEGALIDLDFGFQPPVNAMPGTYTSTVTFTLMSN